MWYSGNILWVFFLLCVFFVFYYFLFLCRVKLILEGLEEDDDDRVFFIVFYKMFNSLEISLISDNEFKCRYLQSECGYGLQFDRWTEYSIQIMESDNLELIFDFFEVSSYFVEGVEKECRYEFIFIDVLILNLV